jgi:hypothetical protein
MKAYGEWRYSSTVLALGTTWRRVVSYTFRPVYSGTYVIGSWVDSTARLDGVERKKNRATPSIEPWSSSS